MIFNIQRYSTHNGLGIRTVVFLKGCLLGHRWCQNPESRACTRDLLCDLRLCLEGCKLYAKAAPEVIECVLNGLFIHRKRLTPEHFTALTDCCPTQALIAYGEVKSVKEVMAIVLCDKPFYDRSGGGLTFSGGEPSIQSETATALLQVSREAGIYTAVEAHLHVPRKYIAPSLPYIDLFLADLKHIVDASFKQWTDDNAARVLDNLKKLVVAGRKTIIRVSLTQGFNADETSVKAITDFAVDELYISEIRLLPYHTLGINKYHLFNLPYDAPEKPLDALELLDSAQQYACRKGLTATSRG